MKNIFKITLVALSLAFFTGCETGDLDLLTSPNNITEDSADANFLLNDIQLSFNATASGLSGTDTGLTRLRNTRATYPGAVDNAVAAEWDRSYQMFSNIDVLEVINANSTTGGIPNHIGVAQVLQAYNYMLLVDHVGDVPFSQANNPEEFPNPSVDAGSDIYDAQLALLDDAISNLNSGSIVNPNDLFFGDFDPANWIALANTLKLRAYNATRLVNPSRATAGINAIAGSNLIDTNSEDFQFQYSTNDAAPDSRHPFFTGNYLAAGAGQYMSNGLYDFLNAGDASPPFVENGIADPRLRYYVYRQDDAAPSGSNLPCAGDPTYFYCYVGNLYWGRDHQDMEGIPNDGTKRSAYGVYPGGGAFDRDLFEQARAASETLEGAGIFPIYLASFTHFTLAEAALTLGTTGNAASLLEEGIRLSMDKVLNFGNLSTVNPDTSVDYAATSADVDAYVTRVLTEYAAANATGKLEIIAREFHLASFGAGLEPYNTYRRTGFPNLQAPVTASGSFPRAWRYPNDEVSGNPNISQQPITTQVFWDNNPAGFID